MSATSAFVCRRLRSCYRPHLHQRQMEVAPSTSTSGGSGPVHRFHACRWPHPHSSSPAQYRCIGSLRTRAAPLVADAGDVAFIVFLYTDLLLLFCCLRRYERAELRSALRERERLKLAVWLLTSALTLLFSYKVAAVMPAAVTAIAWVMGLATVCGGFVFSYADLLLLFLNTASGGINYAEHPVGAEGEGTRLKLAVWLLTSALTLLFSYKVAAVMPAAVTAIAWVMGLATVCGSFVFSYADLLLLFCCLRRYERAELRSALRERERLKLAVWLLTSALTLLFSYGTSARQSLRHGTSAHGGLDKTRLRAVVVGEGQLGGRSVLRGVLVLFFFITVHAAMSIYSSLGDVGAVLSVASAYFNIVALFVSVVLYMQAPPAPHFLPMRSRLKAAVWMLTTLLTFQYVYGVMGATKPTLNDALLLWTMPAATGVAALYVFLHEEHGGADELQQLQGSVV
ncbi:hypothetical protein U9M48_025197 [Paspalum notatum var. saurae]|uniref:Uncharacterized protein n=1 Tax=Paspalum notatum var. saurae TaxID=547442 RepID=A0AAQ3WXQ1_PASNO